MRSWKLIVPITWIVITTVLVAFSANTEKLSLETSSSADQNNEYISEKGITENPLKPAGTSSPRDTIQSFIADKKLVLAEWKEHQKIVSPACYQAYVRVLSALDFRTTPDGNSGLIRSRRSLMLWEILSRIALPHESEIPGDDEVAHNNLSQWTIPGTRITIQRVGSGPRSGEFLFSAGTVQRLHRFYRQVKHLPYKPGFPPGHYEASLRSKHFVEYLEGPVRNRLRSVDTSSPRSTIKGFIESVNRAYSLVMEANVSLKADPPIITLDEAREIEITARNLMKRAQGTLDLNRVPEAIRDDKGIESVLQLKEIFDRMSLPPLESVPDIDMVKAEREALSSTALGNARPVRFRYPNTFIEIVEIMEGDQQGKFLFSAETVSNLDRSYKKVKDLPYRGDIAHIATEYDSVGEKSEGFYEYYISTPGYLIHQALVLGRLVDNLPDWFKMIYADQTVWQWIALVFLLFLGVVFLVILHGRLLRQSVKLSPANRYWRRVIFYLIASGTVLFLYNIFDDRINLTGSVLYLSSIILSTISWVSLSIAMYSLGNALAETIVASPKIDPEGIQASYIRALLGILGFLAAAALIIIGLSRVGVSLIPLLTGVGIGGLAIALAARPTIENIIGSFMIFMDKPYRVGHRVNVMGQDGTVESIGIRSTKIRLMSGHLTSIPNEKMAAVEVVNIHRRPYILRDFNITITYDTPPEKVNRALEILREILSVPKTSDEEPVHATGDSKKTDSLSSNQLSPALAAIVEDIEQDYHPNWSINMPGLEPRVSFNEFNADSLNIRVIYWYHPPDRWRYLDHASRINVQILERFNVEGIDFGFPTQTLHLAGDEKHPINVGQPQFSKD